MLVERFMPEMSRLPPQVRAGLTAEAMRKLGFTAWRGFGLGVAAIVASGVAALASGPRYGRGPDVLLAVLIYFGIACTVLQSAFVLSGYSSVRRYIRRQLNERNYPTCMGCGYDLTGNRSGSCPECGEDIGGSASR
jgi:hypothetical protein